MHSWRTWLIWWRTTESIWNRCIKLRAWTWLMNSSTTFLRWWTPTWSNRRVRCSLITPILSTKFPMQAVFPVQLLLLRHDRRHSKKSQSFRQAQQLQWRLLGWEAWLIWWTVLWSSKWCRILILWSKLQLWWAVEPQIPPTCKIWCRTHHSKVCFKIQTSSKTLPTCLKTLAIKPC